MDKVSVAMLQHNLQCVLGDKTTWYYAGGDINFSVLTGIARDFPSGNRVLRDYEESNKKLFTAKGLARTDFDLAVIRRKQEDFIEYKEWFINCVIDQNVKNIHGVIFPQNCKRPLALKVVSYSTELRNVSNPNFYIIKQFVVGLFWEFQIKTSMLMEADMKKLEDMNTLEIKRETIENILVGKYFTGM